jgi:AAA ATPase domain
MLRGRGRQCGVLDGLLADVQAGRSRVLVVRGEPGIGKTALLEYAIQSASGFRVARAAGVESEMELAFATLHQLCTPMLDRLEGLPGPQHDAVGVAFGLTAGNAPDRFLVGLAVLSLLSAVGEKRLAAGARASRGSRRGLLPEARRRSWHLACHGSCPAVALPTFRG